jgi:hypothetical protein
MPASVFARAWVVVLASFRLRPGLGGIRNAAGLLDPGLLRPGLLDARLFHPRLLHARLLDPGLLDARLLHAGLLTCPVDIPFALHRPFALFGLALKRLTHAIHLALRPFVCLALGFA